MNCNIFAQSYKVSPISWDLSTYSLCKQEFTSHLTYSNSLPSHSTPPGLTYPFHLALASHSRVPLALSQTLHSSLVGPRSAQLSSALLLPFPLSLTPIRATFLSIQNFKNSPVPLTLKASNIVNNLSDLFPSPRRFLKRHTVFSSTTVWKLLAIPIYISTRKKKSTTDWLWNLFLP